jgi:hypothetical protein
VRLAEVEVPDSSSLGSVCPHTMPHAGRRWESLCSRSAKNRSRSVAVCILNQPSIYLVISSQFLISLFQCSAFFRSPCCLLSLMQSGCINSSWRPGQSASSSIHQDSKRRMD